MKITILGAGAWGSALAIHFSKLAEVSLWTYKEDHAIAMQKDKENKDFLPNFTFSKNVTVTSNLSEALQTTNLIIYVVPVNVLRSCYNQVKEQNFQHIPFLWACKGFESESGYLPHQILESEGISHSKYGALSGPNFAKEVAQGLPCASILSSYDNNWLQQLLPSLNSSIMRFYSNNDLIGTEIGGAIKNVIAIATGVCDGLNYGFNARAALITRGMSEIHKLALKLGAKSETLFGLSGFGDLILTCTGTLSRNYQVGMQLAQGKTLNDIINHLGHVAEGVNSVYETRKLALKHKIDMPITESLYLLFENKIAVQQLQSLLMDKSSKAES